MSIAGVLQRTIKFESCQLALCTFLLSVCALNKVERVANEIIAKGKVKTF